MFKEVLEITPKMNSTDLAKMEKSLGTRFANAAKSFGHGLMNAIKGGAIATLIEKFLNPLKEIQDSIDKTLEKGSTLSTQAKQFGSSSGELAKLHAFGAASGIDDQQLNILVEKFQSAVTSATQNPGEHSAVRQFVGQKDMVQGFFDFIQNLKKLDETNQLQVQEEVFGAKQTLKMSEFLHADFNELNERFKDINVADLTKASEHIAKLANEDQANKAYNRLQDIIDKSDSLGRSKNVIGLRDTVDQTQLARENDRIERFDQVQSASLKIDKIQEDLEKLVNTIVTKLPFILDSLTFITTDLTKGVNAIGGMSAAISRGVQWARTHDLLGRKIKGK